MPLPTLKNWGNRISDNTLYNGLPQESITVKKNQALFPPEIALVRDLHI